MESLRISDQNVLTGLKVLATLMKHRGLLEFDFYGCATLETLDLFHKATSLWIERFPAYCRTYGVWRKSKATQYREFAGLIIDELKGIYSY